MCVAYFILCVCLFFFLSPLSKTNRLFCWLVGWFVIFFYRSRLVWVELWFHILSFGLVFGWCNSINFEIMGFSFRCTEEKARGWFITSPNVRIYSFILAFLNLKKFFNIFFYFDFNRSIKSNRRREIGCL